MRSADEPIAVIGGGLTGLVTAYTLRHNSPWPPVILFEADARLGGKIKTTRFGDRALEEGADSFLSRDPIVVDLCTNLGIAEELVRPAMFGAQIYSRGSLHPLPPGSVRGVPSSVRSALRSDLLTTWGALRTAADLAWPRRLTGSDVSFGDFVARHFGREVVERLVSAVMSGTRAGVPEEVSLAAAAAEIDAIARTDRSVMRGLRRVRREGGLETGPPPFRSLRLGLSRLIETLHGHLGSVDVRMGAAVERIERTDRGYALITEGRQIEVAGAVVTTPAATTARIVAPLAPEAARALNMIRYSSSASIMLRYPAGSIEPPPGSGLLIPASENTTLTACTWYSRKWPHHAPDDGSELVRAFVGRADRAEVLGASDAELTRAVHDDLHGIVGVQAAPIDASVQRWNESLPQYAVGHFDLVDRIERDLAAHPVVVAGAGLRGSGIPDCVRQAQRAAGRVITPQ